MGRISLDAYHHLVLQEETEIAPEQHAGLAFLLNSTYKSGMSALALYEATRGVWVKGSKRRESQICLHYIWGLIMEVYQIECWVKAGSQQYFYKGYSSWPRHKTL